MKENEEKYEISEDKDDVVIEELEEEKNPEALAKKLRARLKSAENEKMKILGDLQRAKADFVNLRKRDEEEKREFVKFSNKELLENLIPVLDSFELALKEPVPTGGESWEKGIRSIRQQLEKILSEFGLEQFGQDGETFDPALHEAVSTTPVAEKEKDHKVISVLQKGFKLHGKVLRGAKVVVGELEN